MVTAEEAAQRVYAKKLAADRESKKRKRAEVAELVKRYVPGSRSERFQVRTSALALIKKKKKIKKVKTTKKN